MYVATIIPIARGIPFDTLSYYCNALLVSGTVVSIPFGKQLIHGLVVECVPLTQAKTLIKQASFSLKKVTAVLGYVPYFDHAIRAFQSSSIELVTPVGAIAGATLPQFLFEHIQGDAAQPHSIIVPRLSPFFDVQIASTITRVDHYKRLIRTAFAEKKSVYVVAPTIRGLTLWQDRLEKGIQKHIVVLHSKLTKAQVRAGYTLIKSSERPLLVFVTPGFFMVPRIDLGHVILEYESSNLYKTSDRYAIDTRIVIRHFCTHASIALTMGDILPRFETLHLAHIDTLPRAYIPEKLHVVAVDQYTTTLPTEVLELIRHAEKKKYRVFIYAMRKGIAPLSRCNECRTIVNCPTCELPLVLRNRILADHSRERYFVCTHCGDGLPATHTCSYCGSWHIVPMAIGTESIVEEIHSLVGREFVHVIDDDVTPDAKEIESLMAIFRIKKFGVIVGTTKVLPYLKGIDYTIFPHFDRLLSIPSITTTESALRLVMECNEVSSGGVLLCTRTPDYPLMQQFKAKKIQTIIRDDLDLRRELSYPPFGLVVKIAITVPEGHRQKIKESVEHFFKDTDINPLPARRISQSSMKVLMTWIIKAPTTYIEEEGFHIAGFLDTLHFPYKIEQNPERF